MQWEVDRIMKWISKYALPSFETPQRRLDGRAVTSLINSPSINYADDLRTCLHREPQNREARSFFRKACLHDYVNSSIFSRAKWWWRGGGVS